MSCKCTGNITVPLHAEYPLKDIDGNTNENIVAVEWWVLPPGPGEYQAALRVPYGVFDGVYSVPEQFWDGEFSFKARIVTAVVRDPSGVCHRERFSKFSAPIKTTIFAAPSLPPVNCKIDDCPAEDYGGCVPAISFGQPS